ncbi:unnamed protein product [Polarella glacialis]|uniref:Uncharacterized protein n=1 Tax=Polarella glacialis TaxID=89957 RepID=A0A813IXY6_POLGL|nr:unnamed protein product [Polarella glacialis]
MERDRGAACHLGICRPRPDRKFRKAVARKRAGSWLAFPVATAAIICTGFDLSACPSHLSFLPRPQACCPSKHGSIGRTNRFKQRVWCSSTGPSGATFQPEPLGLRTALRSQVPRRTSSPLVEAESSRDSVAAAALDFCSSSGSAVVVTVWPSGTSQLEEVRLWLISSGSRIVHSQPVSLSNRISELLLVMALYQGEEWLESNCWYHEQPLPDGPPASPYAGAKWKHALCFRNQDSRDPFVFVLDVSGASTSLWSDKYRVRSMLARRSGNPGNSCIHLTDDQRNVVGSSNRGSQTGGYSCDSSYAFACARTLFHPASLGWLNSVGADSALELGSSEFHQAWGTYCDWLLAHDPAVARSPDGNWNAAFPANAQCPPTSPKRQLPISTDIHDAESLEDVDDFDLESTDSEAELTDEEYILSAPGWSWEFPLTAAEKQHRVLLLYDKEKAVVARERRSVEGQAAKLRTKLDAARSSNRHLKRERQAFYEESLRLRAQNEKLNDAMQELLIAQRKEHQQQEQLQKQLQHLKHMQEQLQLQQMEQHPQQLGSQQHLQQQRQLPEQQEQLQEQHQLQEHQRLQEQLQMQEHQRLQEQLQLQEHQKLQEQLQLQEHQRSQEQHQRQEHQRLQKQHQQQLHEQQSLRDQHPSHQEQQVPEIRIRVQQLRDEWQQQRQVPTVSLNLQEEHPQQEEPLAPEVGLLQQLLQTQDRHRSSSLSLGSLPCTPKSWLRSSLSCPSPCGGLAPDAGTRAGSGSSRAGNSSSSRASACSSSSSFALLRAAATRGSVSSVSWREAPVVSCIAFQSRSSGMRWRYGTGWEDLEAEQCLSLRRGEFITCLSGTQGTSRVLAGSLRILTSEGQEAVAGGLEGWDEAGADFVFRAEPGHEIVGLQVVDGRISGSKQLSLTCSRAPSFTDLRPGLRKM